jgi:hypothetical protein
MSKPTILGFLTLAIAWLSIASGYSGCGQPWGALVALVPIVIFGIAAARDARPETPGSSPARRPRAAWTRPAFQESACLAAVFCVSATGILVGADAFPMILGATASLAAWDLFSANRPTAAAGGEAARSYERKRELLLALALATGLPLAAAGKLLPLRMPFVVVVLLVLLDAYSLDRLSRFRSS